ncbi:MAG: replicative DNA helicase [Candidatus Omnitrophica bacterium CG11_big_fil_rev_8_21_14_0_20_42_13]|uniref:Replicative DNA helicase n=1 Tax=Candidatus Ghiorseimicrobium undicola TaxID=1974746 RepID=A0A2H0LZK4_9BACT|nr:MAG: replicative DNA helicase [Candidatus Omnitrophica bacterium CG11_big_fil_rev_8_21_14_0_20_42_13]
MSDPILDKIPPQNIEAEMAVLGSMLLEEDAIHDAIEVLDESHFYKDIHRKIFSCVVNLSKQNKPVDLITLTAELKSINSLDDIGGASYLTSLVNAVPTAANVKNYARIVKEKSVLRLLINKSTQIITDSYNADSNVDELLDKAESVIFEISDKRVEGSFLPIHELVNDAVERIDKLYQNKSQVTGLPSGFVDFDRKTAGFQSSDLIIIAGRPSMGKSAFSLCIANYIGVMEKIPVAFFSLEMSKEQLVQRLLCLHARVDAHSVRTGFLSTSDWPKITAAAGKLSESAIFIDDTPAISILELRAKARRLKSQYGIKLIIVDYLQLMRSSIKSQESRQQEISEISRSLKALARELDVALIAISQLSRAVESRIDHKPQLSDLRESGAIEQDADVVVFLFREEYYNPTESNKGLADVIISKQRNGPVGTIKLTFLKEYTKFEDSARVFE